MDRDIAPGDCVVVTANSGEHPARVGDRFIVHYVDDSDSTLRLIPQGSSTVCDFWVPIDEVKRVEFGWSYARTHLPPEVAALLSACDGIECISLNRGIKSLIVDGLPDWRERVMHAIEKEGTR